MPVKTEITKSNDRKNLKKTQCISSQRIIMEEKYKIKKKHNKFEREFKMTFFFIRGCWNVREKRWGKYINFGSFSQIEIINHTQ